jgi:hypothetical protein
MSVTISIIATNPPTLTAPRSRKKQPNVGAARTVRVVCDMEWPRRLLEETILEAFDVREIDRVQYNVEISKIDDEKPPPDALTVQELGIQNQATLRVKFLIKAEGETRWKSPAPARKQPRREAKGKCLEILPTATAAFEAHQAAEKKAEKKRKEISDKKRLQAQEKKRQREAAETMMGGNRVVRPKSSDFKGEGRRLDGGVVGTNGELGKIKIKASNEGCVISGLYNVITGSGSQSNKKFRKAVKKELSAREKQDSINNQIAAVECSAVKFKAVSEFEYAQHIGGRTLSSGEKNVMFVIIPNAMVRGKDFERRLFELLDVNTIKDELLLMHFSREYALFKEENTTYSIYAMNEGSTSNSLFWSVVYQYRQSFQPALGEERFEYPPFEEMLNYFLPATKDVDETATKKVPVNYSAELRSAINRHLEKMGYKKSAEDGFNTTSLYPAEDGFNDDFFVSWEYMANKRKRKSDDDDRFYWQERIQSMAGGERKQEFGEASWYMV